MKLKPKETDLNAFGASMRTSLLKFTALPDEDWSLLWKKMSVRTFKKGEEIVAAGQVCEFIGFLAQGVCRVYCLENEKEITTFFNFSERNAFVSSFSSFLMRNPSEESVQALEDTLLLVIHHKDLEELYEKSRALQKLGRLMAEYNYVLAMQRIYSLRQEDPADRYEHLLALYPNLINRIPQRYIASYLNISPEAFSRLLKSYFKS